MKKLALFILAVVLLAPAFASAQVCNPGCSAPKTCVATNQCGYASGSPAANCLNTCSGQCTISQNGSATCSTDSSSSSGTTGNGGCPAGSTWDTTFDQCISSSGAGAGGCPPGSSWDTTYDTCVPNSSGLSGSTGANGNTSNTTSGAGGVNQSYIQGYEQSIVGIINNLLVPILVAVSFIVFLYGVFKYFILGAASEESRSEGAKFVMYGIIGFVIIFSVWGLVNLLMGTLNLTSGGVKPTPPTL